MARALELARKAEALGEVPVGAVLVHNAELVGEGWNQPISSNDPSAHAEIMALRDAGQNISNYRFPDCDLYVTLEPCAMCVGAMVHARIRRLIYATAEPKAGAVISSGQLLNREANNHQVEVISGVMAEEASMMLSAFFKRRRAEIKARKLAAKATD